MERIFTIEMNLDDDFANACSYHVDDFKTTTQRNIQAAEDKTETQRWVLVGLANSINEAKEKAEIIRRILCQKHKKTPYGIEELLYNKPGCICGAGDDGDCKCMEE